MDVKWLVSRLKSMNISEIIWRIQQKILQIKEYKRFFIANKPVTEIAVPIELEVLIPDGNRLGINWNNTAWHLFEGLDIFGVFEYSKYKTSWSAGFQTENKWPISDFSYNISINQREDIGDIRTNWELNRHFQFVGLAKNYYVTGDAKYLDELISLFYNWNDKNLFLHGVEWTSAMEVAIRVVSWSYMYAFIEKANGPKEFLYNVSNGIKVMADHILAHRAKYSSANNHLIVEMLGIGVAGIFFGHEKWIDYSVRILTEELPKQNYPDGVNKEMSLHYQSLVMEAYGIIAILLRRNGRQIPEIWLKYLTKMSKFVADCCGDYGETIVFGDNDEGKILDFAGKVENYYYYVLQLMGIILMKKYIDSPISENIKWIATKEELDNYRSYICYKSELVSHYKKGGYTVLRSKDRKALIGFDHAELGFGTIAAHGHEDVLSIQMFYEGKPVLIDSGTYNYHVPKEIRNKIRSVKSHNTFRIGKNNQAEMLGPFLWGKRYRITNSSIDKHNENVMVSASIIYEGASQTRKISFDFKDTITVTDEFNAGVEGQQVWNIISMPELHENNTVALLNKCILRTMNVVVVEDSCYSERYNHLNEAYRLIVKSNCGKIKTEISIKG